VVRIKPQRESKDGDILRQLDKFDEKDPVGSWFELQDFKDLKIKEKALNYARFIYERTGEEE
jgi:hypothetical protein